MSRLQWLELFIKIITVDYFSIRYAVKMLSKRSNLSLRTRVLDVGCGTGVLANMFNSKNYFGFDFDRESIFQARRSLPKYKFVEGNATNPPLNNKKFDLVLISGVLHHLNDHDLTTALKKIKPHLNTSAKLIIIEAIPPIFRWNVIGRLLRRLDQGHNIRSLNDYSRLIKKHFKVIDSYQQVGGLVDYGVVFASN